MDNINLHFYPSSIKNESRIFKETETLSGSELIKKIVIVGIKEKNTEQEEKIDKKRKIYRISLITNFLPNNHIFKTLKYGEWILKTFFKFRKSFPIVVNCHSLSTLPLGILFKTFAKSKIIYDAHELETETSRTIGIKKILAKRLEKLLIFQVNSIIVVNDSIAKWYKNQYNLRNIHVIKNVPKKQLINLKKKSNILKNKFNIKKDEILFIYQGLLSKGRGIEIILSIFSKGEKNKHIVFMGYGSLKNVIKKYSEKYINIHFCPTVKVSQILDYTRGADIGLSLIEKTSLSYFYSLPNKIFEYMSSGLPVIASNFPEMKKIIEKNNCGICVDPKSPEKITKAIEHLIKNPNEAKKMGENGQRAVLNKYNWEKESKKLLKVYEELTK